MAKINRRNMLRITATSVASGTMIARAAESVGKGDAIKIQYLEIVTKDVDAACKIYSQMHGVTFGKADQGSAAPVPPIWLEAGCWAYARRCGLQRDPWFAPTSW
jgi:hypothetical protein